MRRGFKHSLPPRGKAVPPASPSPGACPRPPTTSSVVVGMSGSKAPCIGTRLKDEPLPPGTGAPNSRALLVSAGWFCTFFFFFQNVGNFLAHFPIGQKEMLEKMQMEHVPASLLQILRPEPEKFSALVPASQNHKKEGATHLVPSDFFSVPLRRSLQRVLCVSLWLWKS